jgi:multimeric flavodoxin WrbA
VIVSHHLWDFWVTLLGRCIFSPDMMDASPPDYSDLRALILNCTLKPTPQPSNTEALAENAAAIMRAHGVHVESLRAADYVIPPGIEIDMTSQDCERDDWPIVQELVLAADILVLATPIWLGDKSSVCTKVIERLYAHANLLNARDQWLYYGRVGGVAITGKRDGLKQVGMQILYALQYLGYAIPPQGDFGWIGGGPPSLSYADPGSGGPEHDHTRRNTAFTTCNLMHLAALLKRAGGFPAYGNQRPAWESGLRFGHP